MELKWRLFLGLLTWINHCYLLKKAFCNSSYNGRRWRYLPDFSVLRDLAPTAPWVKSAVANSTFFIKKLKISEFPKNMVIFGIRVQNEAKRVQASMCLMKRFLKNILTFSWTSFCIETRMQSKFTYSGCSPRHTCRVGSEFEIRACCMLLRNWKIKPKPKSG